MPMVPAEFRSERGFSALVSLFLAGLREGAPSAGFRAAGIRNGPSQPSSRMGRLASDQPRVARR